jgi:lysyl-tRNA synthetase class 2
MPFRPDAPVRDGVRPPVFALPSFFMDTPSPEPSAPATPSDSELLALRRAKLDLIRARGVDPFGGRFDTTHRPGELRAAFAEGLAVRVLGRITSWRDMGKTQFFDVSDLGGRIQAFFNAKNVSEADWSLFKEGLDIGDWVGVAGETFVTKTGEPSIKVTALTLLSKSLRPLPDKWHGVTDVETKSRQRYLDLIANERSRDTFLKRSLMVAEMRRYLQDRGFLEVETPMLQAIPGGAAARPFVTHHNALDMEFFLRIAPELYLKRLLVGGYPKVFELNRNFRNEGISRRHNPEFTMLEAYWAGADFTVMAELVEDMVCTLAEKFCGGLQITHTNAAGETTRTINLQRPWRRAAYKDLIRGIDAEWFDYTPERRRERARELGVDISQVMEDHEVTQQIFEKLIEEKSFDPLFVTHVPKELVPLARQNVEDPSVVDVYELVINGQEISPGYSELNDPIVQRQRLLDQAGEEVHSLDEEFLLALEHGMPSAGGLGLGIDRLVMMLTGAESIRDVILFPHLRAKE